MTMKNIGGEQFNDIRKYNNIINYMFSIKNGLMDKIYRHFDK